MSFVPSKYVSDRSDYGSASVDTWTRILVSLLGAVCLVKLYVVGVSNINWDEFYYLSQVHEQLNGTLTRRLQAFHVHLFGWLPFISTNEADQVIAARAVMLALQGLTGYLLFRIARNFYELKGALFSVLCYFSMSTIIQHGTSFRADPIATALLVAALYFMLQSARTYSDAWIAGALIALAGAITIKSVFYMPIFAAFMLIQLAQPEHRSRQIKQWFLTFVTAGVGFVALYGLHLWLAGSASSGSASVTLSHAYEKTILTGDFFPRWEFFQRTLIGDFVVWSAIIIGFILALRQLRNPDLSRRQTGLYLLALSLPIFTLLFYRNAFPYYYVFLMAPVSLLAGAAWEALPWRQNQDQARKIARVCLVMLFAASAIHGVGKSTGFNLYPQRQMLSVIHQIFPTPVPYIDRSSMVSSFPKTGIFMSSWGIENYHDAGVPLLKAAIEEKQPQFLLANIEALDVHRPHNNSQAHSARILLREDYEALMANYLPHWGPLYLPGKRFKLESSNRAQTFEIKIPGVYTVNGPHTVWINGRPIRSGQTIKLSRGTHHIRSDNAPATVTLSWGTQPFRPSQHAPTEPLFSGF